MRYVPFGRQVRDPDTGEFIGITNKAFEIRAADKGHLSLTWVEYYGDKSAETLGIAASAFRDSLDDKKLATKAYFAIGQAGLTRETANAHGKAIRIVHAPDGPNEGHVELRRFSDDDVKLLEALALDVYSEHVAVKDLKLI